MSTPEHRSHSPLLTTETRAFMGSARSAIVMGLRLGHLDEPTGDLYPVLDIIRNNVEAAPVSHRNRVLAGQLIDLWHEAIEIVELEFLSTEVVKTETGESFSLDTTLHTERVRPAYYNQYRPLDLPNAPPFVPPQILPTTVSVTLVGAH